MKKNSVKYSAVCFLCVSFLSLRVIVLRYVWSQTPTTLKIYCPCGKISKRIISDQTMWVSSVELSSRSYFFLELRWIGWESRRDSIRADTHTFLVDIDDTSLKWWGPQCKTFLHSLILTHWGQVMHASANVVNCVVIFSDNELWPVRCLTITWTHGDLLSIGLLGINVSKN